MTPPTHALFVNSGILGQRTFARFIHNTFADRPEGIQATQVVLTDGLTPAERLLRRLLCLRVWPDGWGGLKNLDLLRYRAEWNAGLLASRRIRQLEASGERFDVLHFHRQATAYASVSRIRTTPTIVSIDCTQRCVLQWARSRLEARTYRLNVRRDGEIFQRRQAHHLHVALGGRLPARGVPGVRDGDRGHAQSRRAGLLRSGLDPGALHSIGSYAGLHAARAVRGR